MREIKIATRTVPDPLDRPRTFRYSLLADAVEAGDLFCENYGVQISEEGGDTASVRGITTSAPRIHALLTQLVEYAACPASLRDIVEDWL